MNMRVLNHDNIGEIMAGYFPVPQNPIDVGMAGLSGGCGCGSKRRPTLNGLGQVPTCGDGTQPIMGIGPGGGAGCDDFSTPTCPSGYTLATGSGQYSCTNTSLVQAAAGVSTTAINPTVNVNTTSSIIPGVPNQYLMIGVLVLVVIEVLKK